MSFKSFSDLNKEIKKIFKKLLSDIKNGELKGIDKIKKMLEQMTIDEKFKERTLTSIDKIKKTLKNTSKIKEFDYSRDGIKQFKKAFNEVLETHGIKTFDDKNQNNLNSLILYSGKVKNSSVRFKFDRAATNFFKRSDLITYDYVYKNIRKILIDENYRDLQKNEAGCLYFGDADAKDSKVKNILNRYRGRFAFIQIPHHGSKNNNDDFILNQNAVFIIFAGIKNTYNHPSEIVIERLNNFRKTYYIITENRESELLVFYETNSL